MNAVVSSPRRPRSWRKTLLRLFVFFVVVPYCFVALMLTFLQRSLIYAPARVTDLSPRAEDRVQGVVHALEVETQDGLKLHGWHVNAGLKPCPETATAAECFAGDAPVLLFFSGNAGHRGYRIPTFQLLAACGAHVLVFDYRGYGDNPGKPSESALSADALSIWKYATEGLGIDPQRIVIYGESLGGGVATQLAAKVCEAGTPPGGLVLCATFSSLVDTAAFHYPWLPVRLVLIDRFASQQVILQVTCPILQLHGVQDTIVPYALGQRLFAAAPEQSRTGIPKQFVTFPDADHNDILDVAAEQYRQAIQEFLEKVVLRHSS